MRDFDLAINGLKIFDETHNYGIFENDEFIDELEKIQATVPEKTEEQKVKDGDDIKEVFEAKQTTSTTAASTVNDHSGWNKIKCKKKIEAYILENYSGEEIYPEGLPLEIAQKWCDLIDQEEELPFEEYRASLTPKDPEIYPESKPEVKQEMPSNTKFDEKVGNVEVTVGATESQSAKIAALRAKSDALKLQK